MDRLEKIIKIIIDEYSKTCGERKECEGCKYYNGNCNLDHLMNSLFKWDKALDDIMKYYNAEYIGRDKAIKKEQSITLKNVDTRDKNLIDQIEKIIEDEEEITKTVINYVLGPVNMETVCKEDTIKAFWDMVQAGIGVMKKTGISADDVMKGYSKYLEKLKK